MAMAQIDTKDFATGTAGDDADRVTMWKSAGGSSAAEFLGEWASTTDPAALAVGGRYRIAENQFTLMCTPGTSGLSEEGCREMLRGLLAGTRYLQLHDGDTGAQHVSNRLTTARVAVALADWTIT